MVILGGGNYFKGADVKDGEIVKIVSEGEWELTPFKKQDGSPKNQFCVDVENIEGKKKKLRINKTNSDILILAWGKDTALWVGKSVRLTTENALVAGKRVKSIMVEPIKEEEKAWDENK